MRRPIPGGLALVVPLALTLWACGDKSTSTDTTPTTPTTPTPTPTVQTVTETFDGTLTFQATLTHTFSVEKPGLVTATLVTVAPDATFAVGFGLGRWDGTACTVVLQSTGATQGTVLRGTTSAAGTFCVTVFDVANLLDEITYTAQVVHP